MKSRGPVNFDVASYNMKTCLHPLGRALLLAILLTFLLSCRPSANNNGARARNQVSRETVRLLAAATQGDINEMDAAVKAGADVNGSDEVVGPPLVAAASTGNHEAVKFLLDKGANVNATDSQGMTPLMMASASGRVETVQYLLANGANPNASTMIGIRTAKITALSLARSKNNETVVRLLLDAGARE